MPRRFNGSAGFDEIIVCGVGALSGCDGGPITIAAITTPSAASSHAIVGARNAAAERWGLLRESDGKWFIDGDFTGFDASAADGERQLIAVNKGSGAVAARWHLYRYSTATWTHTNGSSPGDPGVPDEIRIGRWYNRADGDIEIAAVWTSELTDAQIELLAHSYTSWVALAPAAGWRLDQDTTSTKVVDWTGGGANETSITGTAPAVVTGGVPSWTYGAAILVATHAEASGTTHTVDHTDSAGLTDTLATTIGNVTTDQAGLTDNATVESARFVTASDSAGLTDTAALQQTLAATDLAGLTDTAALAQTKTHTDTAGLTDSLVLAHQYAHTDGTGLTDNATVLLQDPYTPAYLGIDNTTTAGGVDTATR